MPLSPFAADIRRDAAPIAAAVPIDTPNHFVCPISLEIMRDPVRLGDGTQQCYERDNIEAWFASCAGRPRSPLTNLPLQSTALRPADDLRREIAAYRPMASARGPSDDAWAGIAAPRSASSGRALPAEPSAPPWPGFGGSPNASSAPPLAAEQHAAPSLPLRSGARPNAFSRGSEPAYAARPPEPPARRATAEEFTALSSHARNHLHASMGAQGWPSLSTAAAATLGAMGGAVSAGAIASGIVLSTALVPCLAAAAGLALVGLGATVGTWLRQRLANKALAEAPVMEKMIALAEIRSAFQALHGRSSDEEAVLAHVTATQQTFDKGPALRRHLKWSAGAAVLAVPAGVLAALWAVSKAQGNDSARPSAPAYAAAVPPPCSHRCAPLVPFMGPGWGYSAPTTHVHVHTQSRPHAFARSPLVRVPLKQRWRAALGAT